MGHRLLLTIQLMQPVAGHNELARQFSLGVQEVFDGLSIGGAGIGGCRERAEDEAGRHGLTITPRALTGTVRYRDGDPRLVDVE
jgi:hypothetical protein